MGTIEQIPAERLSELALGAESRTLVEHIAVDQHALVGSLSLSVAGESAGLGSKRLTERMDAGARVLLRELERDTFEAATQFGSDVARSWGAVAVGLLEHLPFEERLAMVEPFATDHHFMVREWAWLGLRDHLAADLKGGIHLLANWARSEDPYLRRFASELSRPRGVWCKHIPELKRSPGHALPILQPMREDEARYVQLSVGNWLNDASKSAPEWVLRVCADWLASPSDSCRAICRRGLRSLGQAAAELLGHP